MGPLDWLILAIWAVTGVETGIELKKKRWGAAAVSALVFALLTWLSWRIFPHLAALVASWF